MDNVARATCPPARLVSAGGARKRRRNRRRCWWCDARLRSGNRSGVCSPCHAVIHALLYREAEARIEEEEEAERRAAQLVSARPKDLVVVVDEHEKDARPSSNIVSECELAGWQYVEPPYGEKLRIGFAMIAGRPVRL